MASTRKKRNIFTAVVPEELIAEMDAVRDDFSRSFFVRRAIKFYIASVKRRKAQGAKEIL